MNKNMSISQLSTIFNNFKACRSKIWFHQAYILKIFLNNSYWNSILKKRFYRQVQKLNTTKTPNKCAKIYLKIYRDFKKEFSGFFISLPDWELNTLKFNLLAEYLKHSLKDGKLLIDYIHILFSIIRSFGWFIIFWFTKYSKWWMVLCFEME